METRSGRRRVLWGGFLIILGCVSLLQYFVELSLWTWAILLAVLGLGFFVFYVTEPSQKGLLIPSYAFLVVAGLLISLELDILRGDAVAVYMLTAMAIPFLYLYLRDRKMWWALIPAYVMFVVTGLIGFNYIGIFEGDAGVPYIMFAIALPFLFVYVRNTRMWWALIPGGIMVIIGLAFLLTVGIGRFIGPGIIIVVGLWFLFRTFFRPTSVQVSASDSFPSLGENASQVEEEAEAETSE